MTSGHEVCPVQLVTRHSLLVTEIFGAGNGIRTHDFDLGKVALYH